MTGYVPRDLSKIVGAWISPATSKFILHRLKPDAITGLAAAGSVELQGQVLEDVQRLLEAARFYDDAQREPEAPVSPSVTSCKSSEEWITAKEAAEILCRGERTVSNYRAAGDITGRKKNGKTWEYDKASVEEFALQLQMKAA